MCIAHSTHTAQVYMLSRVAVCCLGAHACIHYSLSQHIRCGRQMMRVHEKRQQQQPQRRKSSCSVLPVSRFAFVFRARAALFHSIKRGCLSATQSASSIRILRECTFTSLHLVVDRFALAWQWHISACVCVCLCVFIIRRFAYECIISRFAMHFHSFVVFVSPSRYSMAKPLPNLTLNYYIVCFAKRESKKSEERARSAGSKIANHAKCSSAHFIIIIQYVVWSISNNIDPGGCATESRSK